MQIFWFLMLAAFVVVYAILDGFDLGVGALLPFITKNDQEREQAHASIGPVWNGNEVWLLAGGGVMFMAFPRLYASAFSGFYLALMLVLWLLMLRGIGYEFRHAHPSPLWKGLWDTAFSVSSALLAVLFGVAVGNVLRGVPLNAQGEFQGSFALMLNPFALVAGVLCLVTLCLHGAAYLTAKADGALQARARQWAGGFAVIAAALAAALAGLSPWAHPGFNANFVHFPLLLLVPALAVGALVLIGWSVKTQNDGALFGGTSLFIAMLLGSAAAGMFPRMLPALGHPEMDLTLWNSAASQTSLVSSLAANAIGLVAVIAYTIYLYKLWGGKTPHATHE